MGYASGCLGTVDHSPVTAWVAAVQVNGGTVSAARRILVNNLIVGLQGDGVFQKLDLLRIYAAENQVSARVNMVQNVGNTGHSSALATVVGSPTFTVDRGYTGIDASTVDYIDSNWDPVNNGKNYTVNSAHFSAWCTTDIASSAASNGGCMMGASDNLANPLISLYNTFKDGNIYGRINDNVASGAQGIPATRIGHWVVNRTSSTQSQIYQNATLFSSPNATAFASFPAAFDIYVLACDETQTTAFGGNPNQVAAVTIGGGLTTSDINSLYSHLRSYMNGVGIP